MAAKSKAERTIRECTSQWNRMGAAGSGQEELDDLVDEGAPTLGEHRMGGPGHDAETGLGDRIGELSCTGGRSDGIELSGQDHGRAGDASRGGAEVPAHLEVSGLLQGSGQVAFVECPEPGSLVD